MPLTKLERICSSCNFQYILVTNEDEVIHVGYCPFCGEPVESQEVEGDEE